MKSSLPNPSKADKLRFQMIQDIGCIVCLRKGFYRAPDVHHLLRGGRRISHQMTIGLCPYHHRNVPESGHSSADMRRIFGPSLLDGSRLFRDTFGSDDELLAYQNDLIERLNR